MTSGRSDGTNVHEARNQRSAFGAAPVANGDAHPQIAQTERESVFGPGNSSRNNGKIWSWGSVPFRGSFEQRQGTTGAESSVDGKTGSRSLLSTSESDWTVPAGSPWGMPSGSRARLSNGANASGISTDRAVTTTSADAASSPFHPASSTGHVSNSSAYTSLLQESTALPPVSNPDAAGLRGLNGYSDNHKSTNGSRFPNNPVHPSLQSTPTETEFDPNANVFVGYNSDSGLDTSEHAFMATGRHNSANLPRRPAHSAHQSFHSDLQGNANQYRSTVSQNDLALALDSMQMNDDGYGHRPRPQSQRPGFHTHVSFDASLTHHGQFVNDVSSYIGSFAPSAMTQISPSQGMASLHRSSGASSASPADGSFPRLVNNHHSASSTPGRGHLQTPSGSHLAGYSQNRPSPHSLAQRLHLFQEELQQKFGGNMANHQQPGMHPSQAYAPNTAGNAPPNYYPPSPFNNMQFANMGPNLYQGSEPKNVVPKNLMSDKLRDFKANFRSNKRWELKDIYGYIVEFSGDQQASRFIQERLDSANSDEKERVFNEVQRDALQLMNDPFANYVIQKLFEHGNMTQKKILANNMKGQVFFLSMQTYGCRVVQKALDHVLTDQQVSLVKELEDHVEECVKNANGNHVIQKAVERLPTPNIRFIIDAFKGRILEQSKHTYGCRIVQRMLEHCEEPDRQSILTELHKGTEDLIPDQYGNYVVQNVIGKSKDEDRNKIIDVVKSQLLSFSKHKYASNVVEKTLVFGGEAYRSEVLRTVLSPNSMGESPLLELVKDLFGNYVIQTLLTTLKREESEMLARQIEPHLSYLRKPGCGKHILSIDERVCKILRASSSTASPISQSQGTPAHGSFDYSPATTSTSFQPTPQPAEGSQSVRSDSVPSTSPSMGGGLVEQQRQSEPSSVATTPLSETMDMNVHTPSKCSSRGELGAEGPCN